MDPSQVKRTIAGKSANRLQINQSRRFDVQINDGFDGFIWMPIEAFLNASWRHLAVYNTRDTLELILKEQRYLPLKVKSEKTAAQHGIPP